MFQVFMVSLLHVGKACHAMPTIYMYIVYSGLLFTTYQCNLHTTFSKKVNFHCKEKNCKNNLTRDKDK